MGRKTSLIFRTTGAIEIVEFREGRREWKRTPVEAGKPFKVPARTYRDRINYTDAVSSVEIYCRGKYTGIKFWPADFIKYKAITIGEKEIPSPEGVQYEYEVVDRAARGQNWGLDNGFFSSIHVIPCMKPHVTSHEPAS